MEYEESVNYGRRMNTKRKEEEKEKITNKTLKSRKLYKLK